MGNRSARLYWDGVTSRAAGSEKPDVERLGSVVKPTQNPQQLLEDETLDQALRQLTLHGRSGLPIPSGDREHVGGRITRRDVLAALAAASQPPAAASKEPLPLTSAPTTLSAPRTGPARRLRVTR